MKERIAHLLNLGIALWLVVFATIQPFPVYATTEQNPVFVQIPVQVAYTREARPSDQSSSIQTKFTLQALNSAPLPFEPSLIVQGAGTYEAPQSGLFGPIQYTRPGDYFYRISSKLLKGDTVSAVSEADKYIRVSVIQPDPGNNAGSGTATSNGGNPSSALKAFVTVFPSLEQAQSAQAGAAKSDTVFYLNSPVPKTGPDPGISSKATRPDVTGRESRSNRSRKEPSSPSPSSSASHTPTAAATAWIGWIGMAILALIILIGLIRIRKNDKSHFDPQGDTKMKPDSKKDLSEK